MDSGLDMVLVKSASSESWYEPFPDPGAVAPKFQRMTVVPPLIEISNHVDLFGIRSPHCEMCAFFPVELDRMGA